MNYKEQKRFFLCFILFFSLLNNIAHAATASTGANSQTQNVNQTAPNVNDPLHANDLALNTDIDQEPISTSNDPLEGLNRAIFTFNDKVDEFVLKPIATLYNKIMPKPLNQGVHNFYNNIGNLPTIANDILQLNFYQAASDTWRLVVNTTVGIGGLFDVAERINLKPYSNDFGLTMAAWGYSNSTYIVIPFFGPSTIRDGLGLPVDYFAFSIYPHVNPTSARYQLYGLGIIDRRAQLLKLDPLLEEAAIDRYTFIRDAYMQRRTYQIEQNKHRGPGDMLAADNNSDPNSLVQDELDSTENNTIDNDMVPEASSTEL